MTPYFYVIELKRDISVGITDKSFIDQITQN